MIGALLAMPTEDHVQIDATFTDGYASIALSLARPDPSEPLAENLQTDLHPEFATALCTCANYLPIKIC